MYAVTVTGEVMVLIVYSFTGGLISRKYLSPGSGCLFLGRVQLRLVKFAFTIIIIHIG
jgi:hypothetical protein